MGIATVHYLSMNVRNGRAAPPATPRESTSQSYVLTSLVPTTAYTIDWGDGGSTTSATTDAAGAVTKTHTYAAAGTYAISVANTATGQVVARLTVVVGFKDGAVVSDGTVSAGAPETFTGSGFAASTLYSIVWGDGSANTPVTTDGAGAFSETHTYALAAVTGTFPLQVKNGTHVSATLAVEAHGTVISDGTVTHATAETFTGVFFGAASSLVIDWGDGEPTDAVTADGTGGFTKAHTYAVAGPYTLTATVGAITVATLAVTAV